MEAKGEQRMFGKREQDIFARLELDYPAVAIKFCRNEPLGYERAEEQEPLCWFLTKAQKEEKAFYISVENESCMGKIVLGMQDRHSPVGAAHTCGQMGKELGAFRTAAANARLYYEAPLLDFGNVNYVVFCPVSKCMFNPDLVVCVADTKKAQILLRASSYISGDVWESKCSFVMSCSWTYVYPYLSGKVNHLFTGMHLGLAKMGVYPPGLHILTIPYQKLPEMTEALEEMEWDFAFLRNDEHTEERNARIDEFARKSGADIHYPVPVE